MRNGARITKERLSAIESRSPLIVLFLNVLLLAVALVSYGRYAAVYQERLREENLGNIANLNQSSALNATALIKSWDTKLEDIAQYLEKHPMTRDETLNFLAHSNSSAQRQFELIGSDYTGYLAQRDAQGAFIPLSYEKGTYAALQKAFDDAEDAAYKDICFAPEYTDGYTALKYFAVYKHVPLREEDGTLARDTLLLATRSTDVLAAFNSQNGFAGQSTVLIDRVGNYIVSSNDFKSANFYQYLYVYNDLTLDARRTVEKEVERSGSGELYYKNARGEDCVFRYERMTTNDWYCVTCVPIASFRTPVFNVNYVLYAVFALLLMLGLDVAWLQRVNQRLRQSVLREKEASDAKTEFLSRMSHDIRTPLNGIIGMTALAIDEETSPQIRGYLDNIKVSGQFLTGLVNDILDLSKVESGKVELEPGPYTSDDLCRYVEAVVRPLCLEKGLEFHTPPPDKEPPVLLDRLRFNQIVFNLLSNAVKYTPAGGFVELSWERKPVREGRVALSVTVRDNGIGMSESFQEHMFESFSQERAQTANTGSGLGLAIVKSLVGLMDGSISVQSKIGEGSAFTVRLETSVCAQAAAAVPEIEPVRLAGRRVLLCEDNHINTIVAQRMLEKWGIRVDTAENGQLGVAMFAASAPGDYDAILMDVMMPVMDGLTATRAIRALERPDALDIPIIAMTANAYDTDVKNCLKAGMNAHMGKPVDTQQLQATLCAQIGKREREADGGG